MTEAQILHQLRGHFSGEHWAFFDHVPDSTGYSKNRTIDGLAMGLWPSRGLELHACEVKCSRGDWLRELKEPKKADGFFQLADRFWLVTADKDVAKVAEIPKGWGLLVGKPGGGFRRVVDAPALQPGPMTRNLLAAILRRAFETSPSKHVVDTAVEAALAAERELITKLNAKHNGIEVEAARLELSHLKDRIASFEANSGLRIDNWYSGQIGAAVRAIQADGVTATGDRLADEAERLEATARILRNGANELNMRRLQVIPATGQASGPSPTPATGR